MTGYSWITVHLAQFDEEFGPDKEFTEPQSASVWRHGPHSPIGENGFRTGFGSTWGAIGYYASKEAAQTALSAPEQLRPFEQTAREAWHGLLGVTTHRGEIDLSQGGEPHPGFAALEDDPGGVTAVITSAGYSDYSDEDIPRHRAFLEGVEEVIGFYREIPANVVATVFSPPKTPDGVTFTVWRGTPEMLKAAYKNGSHAEMLKNNNAAPYFDRSSFTRLRLLESRGTWGGVDLLAEAGDPTQ